MINRRTFVQGGLAAATALAATGCGSDGATGTDTATSEEVAAEETTETASEGGSVIEPVFAGYVTDAGQYVTRMSLIFDGDVSGIDENTFEVYMTSTVDYGEAKGEPYAYYDATAPLEIVRVECEGDRADIYFRQDQAPTLTWLAEGRNYPAILGFTVEQKGEVSVRTPDGRDLPFEGTYDCSGTTSWSDLVDPEVLSFAGENTDISYRIYRGSNDKLIVWFHGNGEGDLPVKDTDNNIVQLLGNRGGVAWITPEAQEVFGDATVMAFQAPSMWYLALKDNLLETCYKEIQDVIADYGINEKEIYLSGCSAGGFMSTRMLIAYPDLFKAAMICCPALDAANVRSETDDACPTDEELASLKDARTAIWLVQGETDSSVDPELCSKRIFNILTDGVELTETTVEGTAGIASGFTTYETPDNRYKLSLYETCDLEEVTGLSGDTRQGGKLKFAEDYDLDGEFEEVKYSDHWSWVFVLRDNPEDGSGTHIWEWAAAVE